MTQAHLSLFGTRDEENKSDELHYRKFTGGWGGGALYMLLLLIRERECFLLRRHALFELQTTEKPVNKRLARR